MQIEPKKTKLEVGCGNRPLSLDPEWDRMDLVSMPYTTIVGDIRHIPRPDNTYELVYAHWVMEHFHSAELAEVLWEWGRVLKPGGIMRIITNNAEAINQAVVGGEITWEEWNYLTFGGLKSESHQIGLTPASCQTFFDQAGLTIIGQEVQTHCHNAKGELSCPAIIIEATKDSILGPLKASLYHAHGLTFAVRPGMDRAIVDEVITKDVYLDGFLEINPGDVVVDIGAHIGSFAIYAALLGARVTAYEPATGTFQLLKWNVEHNPYPVTIHQVGIMGKSGINTLYIRTDGNFGNTNFYSTNRMEKEDVSCLSLADAFREHKIEKCDFLKLDCEGAEVEILENFPLINIPQVAVEYHGSRSKEKMLLHLSEYDIKIKPYPTKPGEDELGIILAKHSAAFI